MSQKNGLKRGTLSTSFNHNLKHQGVITILNNIPKNTPVIASVECVVADEAAQAIIDWVLEKKP